MPPKSKRKFNKAKLHDCICLQILADVEKNTDSSLHNKTLYYPVAYLAGVDKADVIKFFKMI